DAADGQAVADVGVGHEGAGGGDGEGAGVAELLDGLVVEVLAGGSPHAEGGVLAAGDVLPRRFAREEGGEFAPDGVAEPGARVLGDAGELSAGVVAGEGGAADGLLGGADGGAAGDAEVVELAGLHRGRVGRWIGEARRARRAERSSRRPRGAVRASDARGSFPRAKLPHPPASAAAGGLLADAVLD